MRSSTFYNRYKRELGVGNGPYRFVEWIEGDRVVVRGNERLIPGQPLRVKE